MLKKEINKKTKTTLIVSISLIFFLMLFSIIFSLLNLSNNKIIKGTKIETIDVSGLTQEEATKKLEKYYEEVIRKDITVKYEELEETIVMEELKTSIDIDKMVKEACLIGRSGNIVKNNYEILFSMLFGKNIKCEISLEQEKLNKKIEEINTKLPNAIQKSDYYIEESNLIIKKGKKECK